MMMQVEPGCLECGFSEMALGYLAGNLALGIPLDEVDSEITDWMKAIFR